MTYQYRIVLGSFAVLASLSLACASGEMVGTSGSGTGSGGKGGSSSSSTGSGGSTTFAGQGGSSTTGSGQGGAGTFGTGQGGVSGTGQGGVSGGGTGGSTAFMMMCTPASPLISDMEDGFYYYGSGCPKGSWFLATAGGGTVMGDPMFVAPMGSVSPVAVTNTGDPTSTKGIHVSGANQMNSAINVYNAFVSLSASLNQPSAALAGYLNASAYSGVQFWGKISGPVRLQISTPQTDADAHSCIKCSDHFGMTLTASTAWTQYKIPFNMLTQEGFGDPAVFTPNAVMKILWKVIVPGTATTNPPTPAWDISIDDLTFY